MQTMTIPQKYRQGTFRDIAYTKNKQHFVDLIKMLIRFHDIVLVAHNGHRFDHYFVLEWLDYAFDKEATTFKLLSLKVGTHTLEFKDTVTWFTMKASELGKLVGVLKLPMDINDPAYCCTDTLIVVRALQFIAEYILPVCKAEEPFYAYYGVADVTYRLVQTYLDRNKHLIWRYDFCQIMEASYYGGRVDSCMYGMFLDEMVSSLDISSMYPSSLCRSLPAGNLYISKSPPPDRHYIAYCQMSKLPVSCSSACFGLLPYHMSGCTAYYDYGTFDGWWTSVDIQTAIRDGWSCLVRVAYVFDDSCSLKEIYTHLFNKRQDPGITPQLNYAYKIAMNASYGKFVQHHRGGEWCSRIPYIGWWCTSYAREQMWYLKDLAKHTTILYGDTDSIFILSASVPQMKMEHPEYFRNELAHAQITLKDEGSKRGLLVLSKKSYLHGNKMQFKGMEKDNISKNDYRDALLGETITNTRDGIARKTMRNGLIHIDRFAKLTRRSTVIVPAYKSLCNKCSLYH